MYVTDNEQTQQRHPWQKHRKCVSQEPINDIKYVELLLKPLSYSRQQRFNLKSTLNIEIFVRKRHMDTLNRENNLHNFLKK